jgi:hypothetical protein
MKLSNKWYCSEPCREAARKDYSRRRDKAYRRRRAGQRFCRACEKPIDKYYYCSAECAHTSRLKQWRAKAQRLRDLKAQCHKNDTVPHKIDITVFK